eukprot:4444834-Amphidinium_carterae.1
MESPTESPVGSSPAAKAHHGGADLGAAESWVGNGHSTDGKEALANLLQVLQRPAVGLLGASIASLMNAK